MAAKGTTLATAYVQIKPTTKGIASDLKKQIDGSKVGNEAGNDIGGSMVSTLKKIIVAAGIGKVVKSALDAGGALQQSFGGIETLYGDAAAGAQKYAVAAAKAGISANSYAEQAVSFGAALKQAFGGDVTKAAEAANTAIMDMADNSAKMGTDITAVQNAYQGFAKQNYTMLDNLKLGYGGTKEEMQRLLEDATKLSGIKYDINNLGDVYEAIHVIQGELGVTGVAADEAATTFTGSFGAMRAAAENVLAGLTLGMDITPSLQQLAQSISDFLFLNLLPMVGNFIIGLPTAISTFVQAAVPAILGQIQGLAQQAIDVIGPMFTYGGIQSIVGMVTGFLQGIPEVIAGMGEVLQSAYDTISANMPTILENGIQMISRLADGILQNLPAIISSIGEIMVAFIQFVLSNFPTIMQKGFELIARLGQGIVKNLPAIVSAIGEVIGKLLVTIAQNLPAILQKGIEIVGKIASGLIMAIPQLVAAIPQLISSIVRGFGNHDWGSIGRSLISGIGKGITNAVSGLLDSAVKACKKLVDGVKGFFGIHSPSKVFAGIGEYLDEGLAVGITDNLDVVGDAVQDMRDIATGSFESSLDVTAGRIGADTTSAYAGATTNMGGVCINVYAKDGQDVKELAQEVNDILAEQARRQELAF